MSVQEDLARVKTLHASGRMLEAGRLAASLPPWGDGVGTSFSRKQEAIRSALARAPDRVGPLVGQLLDESLAEASLPHSVFIVHGWDTELKYEAKNYFQNTLGADPVILHEQGGDGGALIDKFEQHARRCALAVVLLSEADDPGLGLSSPGDPRRPRPNVLFEMGYFFSRLGRAGVILLRRGDVELNSDVLGIEWIDVTNGVDAAGESIRRRAPWLSS